MTEAPLPTDSGLEKILATCPEAHELILTECIDGALLMDCLDCPYHYKLAPEEEPYVRRHINEKDVVTL